jgi:hypothetical protein
LTALLFGQNCLLKKGGELMANKASVTFYLGFLGDGSSTTLTADAATAPFALANPSTGTNLSGSFSLASTVPTGVSNATCDQGMSVTASILLGIVTFTFTSAPGNGTVYLLSGLFHF